MRSTEYPDLQFRQPRSWTRGRSGGPPRLIVVHTTEGHEHTQAAEDGAAYDGRRSDGTSAHYFVDPDSVVQCVLTSNTAHTALWNGNRLGIQYELCGRAGQSVKQWDDAASNAILRLAARQAARDCLRYGIPAVRITPRQVAAGAAGFCGHYDITRAFPGDGGTHTDPGPNFPWDEFLGLVRAYLAGSDEEDDMRLTDRVKHQPRPGVTYSSETTTVEGALGSTLAETLYIRELIRAEAIAGRARDELILATVRGINAAGILAKVDAVAGQLAQVATLVQQGQDGTRDAHEVLQLLGDLIDAAAQPAPPGTAE